MKFWNVFSFISVSLWKISFQGPLRRTRSLPRKLPEHSSMGPGDRELPRPRSSRDIFRKKLRVSREKFLGLNLMNLDVNCYYVSCRKDTTLAADNFVLTYWSLGNVAVILNVQFSNSLNRIVAWPLTVKLHSGKCHKTILMRSQYWFR